MPGEPQETVIEREGDSVDVKRRLAFALSAACLALAACGDKTPESEASRRAGDIPKNVIDKAAADTRRALEQGVERNRRAEDGKNE